MNARISALMQYAAGEDVVIPEPPAVPHTTESDGPAQAPVVCVGDTRTADDAATGHLLASPRLRNWLYQARIVPAQCRFDVVYPGETYGNLSPAVCREWEDRALERLRGSDPEAVIVCLGERVFTLLTGRRSLTTHRGSLYEWEGRRVLGLIPPAYVRTRPIWEKVCRQDVERLKHLITPHETHTLTCGCAMRLRRTHHTPYTVTQLTLHGTIARYLDAAQQPQTCLAIDIETPTLNGRRQLTCVSFAYQPTESLVLPFDEYRTVIAQLCGAPCIKVGHNFASYDRWWLKREGIDVAGEIRDTMCMHHALDPASLHSLEYLTSRYTWEPYYKDEGRGHDVSVIGNDWAAYFNYCGLDSCVTRELHDVLWSQLEARQMVEFYREHYAALFDPVLDVMSRGVEIHHSYRSELLETLLTEAREARDRLGVLNGAPLFTLTTQRDRAVHDALLDREIPTLEDLENRYGVAAVQASVDRIAARTVSSAHLKKLLYDKLALPLRTKRRGNGTETTTADAATLQRLRHQYADSPEVCEVLDLAMQHNKSQKLATFLYPNTFDEDGLFRFTLKFNTEASRFASTAAPNGTGRNSQNTPRDRRLRRVVLPDPGHVLVECDLSQVEGRLCFVYTGDPELIRLARLRASEFDQHKFVASLVFGVPVEQVTRSQRQVSKSISHGAQRSMQGVRLAETLLKEGHVITPEEGDDLLERYHKAFPAIRQWHQRIRREIRTAKRLVSSWGHVWDVRHFDCNDDLFRKAYSWKMQRDCAGITNQMGFKPLWYWLREQGMASRIMLQEHDSLVCSCHPAEAYAVAVFLKTHLEAEREYGGIALGVPVEFKVGATWGDYDELPELPERADFEQTVMKWVHHTQEVVV